MKTLFETIRKLQKEINRLKNEKIHTNDIQKRKKIDAQICFYESQISNYKIYTDKWLEMQDSNDCDVVCDVVRFYFYNAISWEEAVSKCGYPEDCSDSFRMRITRVLKNADWI